MILKCYRNDSAEMWPKSSQNAIWGSIIPYDKGVRHVSIKTEVEQDIGAVWVLIKGVPNF